MGKHTFAHGFASGAQLERGEAIPGLTLTETDGTFTFAVAGDGHEWYVDNFTLDGADNAPRALWVHAPMMCPECQKPRDFPRPMGVAQAEGKVTDA